MCTYAYICICLLAFRCEKFHYHTIFLLDKGLFDVLSVRKVKTTFCAAQSVSISEPKKNVCTFSNSIFGKENISIFESTYRKYLRQLFADCRKSTLKTAKSRKSAKNCCNFFLCEHTYKSKCRRTSDTF